MQKGRVCSAFSAALLLGSVFAGSQNAAEPTPESLGVSSRLEKRPSGSWFQYDAAMLLSSGRRLGVRIQDGNAILNGKAASQEEIDAAIRLIMEATGVKSVVSHAKVGSGAQIADKSKITASCRFLLLGRCYEFELRDELITFTEIDLNEFWEIPLVLCHIWKLGLYRWG